jgi:hypothetical protein
MAPNLGLTLQLPKCTALWSHTLGVPQSLLDLAQEHGFTVQRGAMKVLGSIIGTDRDLIKNLLREKSKSHHPVFEAIDHPSMPVQIALILLRLCAIPRLVYLCRTLSLSLTSELCSLFDDCVMSSAVRKLKLGLVSPGARIQLQLPFETFWVWPPLCHSDSTLRIPRFARLYRSPSWTSPPTAQPSCQRLPTTVHHPLLQGPPH